MFKDEQTMLLTTRNGRTVGVRGISKHIGELSDPTNGGAHAGEPPARPTIGDAESNQIGVLLNQNDNVYPVTNLLHKVTDFFLKNL